MLIGKWLTLKQLANLQNSDDARNFFNDFNEANIALIETFHRQQAKTFLKALFSSSWCRWSLKFLSSAPIWMEVGHSDPVKAKLLLVIYEN